MRAAAAVARSNTDAAGPAVLSVLPGLDSDADVLRSLPDTVLDAGDLADTVLERLDRLAGDRGLAAAFYRDGKIDLAAVERIEGIAQLAGSFIESAHARLDRLEDPRFPPLKKAFGRLQRSLAKGAATLDKAETLLDALGGIVGAGERKAYLLLFQSPSEARGSGGIIGVYGILEADEGALDLKHVGALFEIGRKVDRPVDAPQWFEDLYGNLGALDEPRHSNLAFHFPTVARVLLDYYRQAMGRELDGVMTLDPIVLEQMTFGTPPLAGPGWEVKIDHKNARRALLHNVYLRFGRFQSKAQNRFLTGVMTDLLDHLDSGRARLLTIAEGLSKAAKWQHLKFFATDPALGEALKRLEIDGDFSTGGPNVQGVFHNNFTGSKVDYFLQRSQDIAVEIGTDGDARVKTTVTLQNEAPTSPSSLLIRPLLRKVPNGTNRMALSFLLPKGAAEVDFSIAGRSQAPFRGNEAGYPVVWNVVEIPPGSSTEVTVAYTLRGAADGGEFETMLWPQALVRPDRFRFTLRVPDTSGLEVTPARRLVGGAYILSGRLFGPKRIAARF